MHSSASRNTNLGSHLLLVYCISIFLFNAYHTKASAEEFAPSAATAENAEEEKKAARRRTGEIVAEGLPQNIVDAIAEISEETTHIGVKQENPPLWPLYWNTELIGWAFDSINLINIPGFAGTPIDVLVVIDTDGTYVGVKVLKHNEPVLAYGVGPP